MQVRVKNNILICVAVLCAGCSTEEKTSEPIREETDVVDIRLSERQPTKAFTRDSSLAVGFDADNRENRMLIYVPKLTSLYDEDVIVSSIAQIEINVSAAIVDVNPDNIHIYALSRPWTPFATWNSPAGSLGDMSWNSAGGDFEEGFDVTPSLHRNTTDPKVVELGFDVTSPVVKMIVDKKPNYGFAIAVKRSGDNNKDRMEFIAFNSEAATKPRAVLVFTRKDVVAP